MLGPRSSRFYGAALQSGLIDEAGLNACWEMIAPDRRTADAIDRRLARQAISSGKLTLWQAQQLLAGRISGFFIDKYILLSLLGRGGMGRVFLAKDVRLNRTVALKLLSQERMNNPRAIARFRREAKVGAQLQQENLVRVYDEGESAGVLYLVMEHIDGKNIAQVIGELGQIPWPTAARLTRQVALGLEHARLKGLIHRDVNPGNILLTKDGTAKLTDLGLAIDLNDLDNVTRDGATVGTFDYVSPEQAKNSRSVDTRADLYSLGCTIFHMIAGRVPFPMASLPEKLYAHQLHDPEPLTELVPDVPPGLAEVVRRLMRKSPDERYQTPAELATALEPFAIETGWTATTGSNGVAAIERSGSGEGPSVVEGSSVGLTVVTPGTASQAMGDSFFPLDLGPEEPLAGHLHKPSRTRTSSPGPEDGTSPPDPRSRRVKVGVVAVVGFTALLAAGVIATLANMASSRTNPGSSTPTVKPRNLTGSTTTSVTSIPTVAGPVVVRFRDGTSEVATDLPAALARAVRDRAEVILAAGTTVRLSNDPPTRIPDGSVTVRGPGSGIPPTIEITMKGSQPAILARANLKLVDLIVEVRTDGPSEAAVWQAERDLTCERCVFRLATTGESAEPTPGPAMPTGPHLLLAEGPHLTMTNCLVSGFDRPIEFSAGPRAVATLDHSIIINGRSSDDAALVGPALVVRSAYGGGSDVRVKVIGCSTRSRTFLAAEQFSAASPLAVEIADSAIWVNTALRFEPASAPLTAEATPEPAGDRSSWDAVTQAVTWQGHGNRWHITPDGTPWAQFAGTETLLKAPTTLEAWSLNNRETNSQAGVIRFAHPMTEGTLKPGDSGLVTDDGKPTGPDASKIGPS